MLKCLLSCMLLQVLDSLMSAAPMRSRTFRCSTASHQFLSTSLKHVCSHACGVACCLQVLDSLMSVAPMRSSTVADLHFRESDVHASLSASSSSSPIKANPSSCLIAAVGSDKSGALAVMRRGMVADIITAVPSLQAHGAWTLHYRPHSCLSPSSPGASASAATAAAEGSGDSPEGPAAAAEVDAEAADLSEQHHAFVLLSCGGQNTMVLDAGGAQLAELSEDVSEQEQLAVYVVLACCA
jgi:hypothetical protein